MRLRAVSAPRNAILGVDRFKHYGVFLIWGDVRGVPAAYLILYIRSPSALLDDSIFSPPFFPRMLTKPRTVCACQPVAFMISVRVAHLARFISAITSAFLLTRSALGLGNPSMVQR